MGAGRLDGLEGQVAFQHLHAHFDVAAPAFKLLGADVGAVVTADEREDEKEEEGFHLREAAVGSFNSNRGPDAGGAGAGPPT